MTLPVRIRMGIDDAAITRNARLRVVRVEATLRTARWAYGYASATPVAVIEDSAAGRRFRPIIGPGHLSKAAIVCLAAMLGWNRRRRANTARTSRTPTHGGTAS